MGTLESYNAVNKAESESRDFTQYDIVLEMHFDRFSHVIIIGAVKDVNCFWLSRTDTSDRTINAEIFRYIWRTASAPVSRKRETLSTLNISDMDLKKYYYSTRIYVDRNIRDSLSTPFGCYFDINFSENTERFFASRVAGFADEIKKRCRIRGCEGRYKDIILSYKKALSAMDYMDRNEIDKITDILESEAYLVLSEDEEIRRIYGDCMELLSTLYCRYMNEVR